MENASTLSQESQTWTRKLQLTELTILNDFVKLCEDNGLRYYITYGTLIGAVRHKGFIPWDDDIDIAMPRADYEQLKKVAQVQLDTSVYYLQTCDNLPGYVSDIIKLRKVDTLYHSRWIQQFHLPSYGIWIDIFPLDDVPKQSSIPQRIIGFTLQRVIKRIFLYHNNPEGLKTTMIGGVLLKLLNLAPISFYRQLRQNLMRHYEHKPCDYYVIYPCVYGYKKQTIKKSHYEPPVLLEFEGNRYRAPGDYDYILRRIYGDYMTLPPVENRKTHNPVRLSFDITGPDESIK